MFNPTLGDPYTDPLYQYRDQYSDQRQSQDVGAFNLDFSEIARVGDGGSNFNLAGVNHIGGGSNFDYAQVASAARRPEVPPPHHFDLSQVEQSAAAAADSGDDR